MISTANVSGCSTSPKRSPLKRHALNGKNLDIREVAGKPHRLFRLSAFPMSDTDLFVRNRNMPQSSSDTIAVIRAGALTAKIVDSKEGFAIAVSIDGIEVGRVGSLYS